MADDRGRDATDEHHGAGPAAVVLALVGLGAVGLTFWLIRGPGQKPACGPDQLALSLQAQGPGSVSGCGGDTRGQVTICPNPGEQCVFNAWPDPGASFGHWEGPGGVQSTANPVTVAPSGPGYVLGVFNPPAGLPWWP